VSDISHHDLADEAFHEIQLSGKQLVFLFMATTIVAVVIFLCGVQVGRGVRIDRTADATDAVAAATPAPASAAASTVTAAAPPLDAPAPPPEELTYGKQLQSDSTAQEKLKPRTDPAPAAKTAEPPAAPPAKEKPSAATKTAAATGGAPRAGGWVVQVQALKGQAAANAVAQRLAGKGYPAFVLSPAQGAPSIYRVQVGRFNDRREAEQVARRLEKEEQFKPWISH
jgi:cell division septation protein DedD